MAVFAEMFRYGDVEAFAAVFTGTPDSSFSLINIYFSQRLVAFRADVLISLAEIRLQVHVSTFGVLDQRGFLNIKRLAEGTTVSKGDVCGTTFWARNNFVEEFLFQDSSVAKFA